MHLSVSNALIYFIFKVKRWLKRFFPSLFIFNNVPILLLHLKNKQTLESSTGTPSKSGAVPWVAHDVWRQEKSSAQGGREGREELGSYEMLLPPVLWTCLKGNWLRPPFSDNPVDHVSSDVSSHSPLPTSLRSRVRPSHPQPVTAKEPTHAIAVFVTLRFSLPPTPAARMWQCFCSYGIFSVSWKAPEALGDSSAPHPHLLQVQSLCCSMRSSPKTLLGPAAIQKESNADLNQRAKQKGHQF